MSLKSKIRAVVFKILGKEAIDNLRYIKFSKKFSSLINESKDREDFIKNFSRSYEVEMAVLPRLLKKPKTIVDIGANYGTYSFFLSKLYPQSKIIAFEPASSSYNIFRRIINRFSLRNVISVRRGLGAKEEKKEMVLPKGYTIIAHVAGKNTKKGEDDKIEQIDVTTLDSFVKRNKLKNLDLIKCDVEGFELPVFEGAKNTLKKFKPLVFVEIEQRHTEKYGISAQEVLKFFKKLGYNSYSVQKENIKKTDRIVSEIPLYLFSSKRIQ